MKAFRLQSRNGDGSLILDTAQKPQPSPYELLIHVCAAGVTPDELHWYPTTHNASGGKRTGAIPAHEFSGVVAAIGSGVGGLELGREVFGMNDWFQDGALAEYCLAPFFAVAPKPESITHIEAASVPIAALTAWQGLIERGHLQRGERILIHGAAGGVGVYAVQIARLHGAHITATASARHTSWLLELGADEVIDYNQSRFEDCTSDVDLVFDTVGGEILRRSWGVLKTGGRLITIATPLNDDERSKHAFFIVEPNQKQLFRIAELLETRQLRPVVQSVLPMEAATLAMQRPPQPRAPGKVVVSGEGRCA